MRFLTDFGGIITAIRYEEGEKVKSRACCYAPTSPDQRTTLSIAGTVYSEEERDDAKAKQKISPWFYSMRNSAGKN